MVSKKKFYVLFVIILFVGGANAQSTFGDSTTYVTIIAGKEYQKSKIAQWLWGKNWRQEWLTPVRVPVVLLDTVYGGLTPYQKSGGGESKSLRLKSAAGKEYTLRSINKFRDKTLPALLKNSAFGSIVQDGISMSHPYAAFAIPLMLQHANIPHTQPKLVYIPQHAGLDTFNDLFANDLYLLEEKPEGDWRNAPHLGNYKNYLSTTEVKEKLRDNNQYKADQHSFIKARLFDILISDVDRHEGNWTWGVADTGTAIFKPVPNDRDQAFFTHNGLLTSISIALTRRRFLQNFSYTIKNVKTLTSHDQMLDRFFANEMNYNDWIQAAAMLCQSLTDSVITISIQQLPPEIVAVSGTEIIEKLKQRRNKLEAYAARYYYAIAKSVDINGTILKEHFEVKKRANNQTEVNIYRVNNQGQKEVAPYYHRTFNPGETKRITIYGFGGDDVFDIDKDIHRIKIIIQKGINKTQLAKE